MNYQEVKNLWDRTFDSLVYEAECAKQSMIVPDGLVKLYAETSFDDRQHVLNVLRNWLENELEEKSYEVRFLTRYWKIKELIPDLLSAISKLKEKEDIISRNEAEIIVALVYDLQSINTTTSGNQVNDWLTKK